HRANLRRAPDRMSLARELPLRRERPRSVRWATAPKRPRQTPNAPSACQFGRVSNGGRRGRDARAGREALRRRAIAPPLRRNFLVRKGRLAIGAPRPSVPPIG